MGYIKTVKKESMKNNKKIGKDALKKIESMLEKNIIEIIKKASRNADFSGRKIIKAKDIEENLYPG